ncbi:MAG: anti-sigma factor [Candidatus Omnitrophota bacterium]
MKDCKHIQEYLSAYLDQALDKEKVSLVEEHLRVCEVCERELDNIRKISQVLGSLEKVEPPPDFLEKLHERIEKRKSLDRFLRGLFSNPGAKVFVSLTLLSFVLLILFRNINVDYPLGVRHEKAVSRSAVEQEKITELKNDKITQITSGEKGGYDESRLPEDKEYLTKEVPYSQVASEGIKQFYEHTIKKGEEGVSRGFTDENKSFESIGGYEDKRKMSVAGAGAVLPQSDYRRESALSKENYYSDYALKIEVNNLTEALIEIKSILNRRNIETVSSPETTLDAVDLKQPVSLTVKVKITSQLLAVFIDDLKQLKTVSAFFSPLQTPKEGSFPLDIQLKRIPR